MSTQAVSRFVEHNVMRLAQQPSCGQSGDPTPYYGDPLTERLSAGKRSRFMIHVCRFLEVSSALRRYNAIGSRKVAQDLGAAQLFTLP
jgi:hypothetical protein